MDDPNATQGRCSSCGFLSKFDLHYSGPPPYIYEMPPKDRSSGHISVLHLPAKEVGACFPQCYVDAAHIWEEMESAVRAGKHREVAAKDVFEKDRQCPKWHRYTQGYSPQEHLEEERVLELELKRQEFEQRMDRANKEFTERLDLRNRKIQIWLAVILGIFAIAEVLAAFVQVAFPNGWPWLMHKIGSDIASPIPPIPGN